MNIAARARRGVGRKEAKSREPSPRRTPKVSASSESSEKEERKKKELVTVDKLEDLPQKVQQLLEKSEISQKLLEDNLQYLVSSAALIFDWRLF